MIETRLSPTFIPTSRLGDARPHAVVIEPPISPYENPPLGPAILARSAKGKGLRVDVVDWNKMFINTVEPDSTRRATTAVGDHGKDRAHVKKAVNEILSRTGLSDEEPFNVPQGADPVRGMHYGFEAIHRGIERAKTSPFWGEWVEKIVTSQENVPPVVGLSVMGPEQVFPALVLMSAIKDRSPETVTVMGGSHPTLLYRAIQSDHRYTHDGEGRRIVDVVLPGHSEEAFTDLIIEVVSDRYIQGKGTHVSPPLSSDRFDYLPLFSAEQIGLYDPKILTLPLQLTRGCSSGKCAHCTYPEVEPIATSRTGFQASRARDAIAALTEQFGVKKYSIKDSLLTLTRMRQLGEEFLNNGPDKTLWGASTRLVRTLGRDADQIASYGARTLEMGVESIIPGSLKDICKQGLRPEEIEGIVLSLAANEITPVVNLMFGMPSEREDEAQSQLDWFIHLQELARKQGGAPVEGSLNMLLLTKGAPLVARPPEGVVIQDAAPWAYVHGWNEPEWRVNFGKQLADVQMQEA